MSTDLVSADDDDDVESLSEREHWTILLGQPFKIPVRARIQVTAVV